MNEWRVLFTESKRGVRPPPGLPPPWRNPQSSDCSRGFRLPVGTARGSSRTSPRARRPRRGCSQRDGPWRLRPAPHAAPSRGHEAGRHPPHGFPPALQTSAPRARPAGQQRARPPQAAVTATAHLPPGRRARRRRGEAGAGAAPGRLFPGRAPRAPSAALRVPVPAPQPRGPFQGSAVAADGSRPRTRLQGRDGVLTPTTPGPGVRSPPPEGGSQVGGAGMPTGLTAQVPLRPPAGEDDSDVPQPIPAPVPATPLPRLLASGFLPPEPNSGRGAPTAGPRELSGPGPARGLPRGPRTRSPPSLPNASHWPRLSRRSPALAPDRGLASHRKRELSG